MPTHTPCSIGLAVCAAVALQMPLIRCAPVAQLDGELGVGSATYAYGSTLTSLLPAAGSTAGGTLLTLGAVGAGFYTANPSLNQVRWVGHVTHVRQVAVLAQSWLELWSSRVLILCVSRAPSAWLNSCGSGGV